MHLRGVTRRSASILPREGLSCSCRAQTYTHACDVLVAPDNAKTQTWRQAPCRRLRFCCPRDGLGLLIWQYARLVRQPNGLTLGFVPKRFLPGCNLPFWRSSTCLERSTLTRATPIKLPISEMLESWHTWSCYSFEWLRWCPL